MRRNRPTVLPAEIERILDRLEDWRRTRPKRSPIPNSIWQAATLLAAEHGVHRVAKALRLNYPDLKRRAQTVAPAALPAKISAPTFIELACGPSLVPASAPCVVELENAAGVKMKISLPQAGGVDLAALVAAFGSPTP
jgi:hypothetical protein